MPLDASDLSQLISLCRAQIERHCEHLGRLDSAIGDGDHGANMKRGLEAVYRERADIASLPLPAALERIGLVLVMTIGGAAGPLYGTLLMELGRGLADEGGRADFAASLARAIAAVARRGRSGPGDKTEHEVLYPLPAEIARHAPPAPHPPGPPTAPQATEMMLARRGRASYLGARSVGHEDPGASSCALLAMTICQYFQEHNPS